MLMMMMIMNDLRKEKGRIKKEKTYKNCVAVCQVDWFKAISSSVLLSPGHKNRSYPASIILMFSCEV